MNTHRQSHKNKISFQKEGNEGEEWRKHCPDSSTSANIEDILRIGIDWGEKKLVVEQHGQHVMTMGCQPQTLTIDSSTDPISSMSFCVSSFGALEVNQQRHAQIRLMDNLHVIRGSILVISATVQFPILENAGRHRRC